jgi:tetratricopeptide (TPR) repeat protein
VNWVTGDIVIVKKLNATGLLKEFTVCAIFVVGLSSCGGAFNSHILQESFWAGGPASQNSTAEIGLAELAKGNYIEAEKRFQTALKQNPQDVHALLGLGMLYQNNGLTTRARQMYEALLAIRPDDDQQFIVWKSLKTRPISEIASVNLALIESGGILTSMGRDSVAAVPPEPSPISGAPLPSAMTARSVQQEPMPQPPLGDITIPRLAEANSNIISRFKTLIALRDQGLLTAQDYNARRQANIGALLPLSSPPPAAGLDRPVPSTQQISGRLRAIGRGLEMRAISVAQHASERAMILDAMMPSAPISVANPGRPPQGLLQAADSVRWLEQLREGGLITSDEYVRERAAIEGHISPAPPKVQTKASTPISSIPADRGAPEKLIGPQPGVHLASYKSRKDAERGWAQLRRAHKGELASLQSEISETRLGAKGVFFRLKAGPLMGKVAAEALCKQLKKRRQFCEVSFINAS